MAVMQLTKATLWLRQHGASERSFASVLNRYFRAQAERIAEVVADHAVVTPEMVPSLFRADDEHQRLMPIVVRNVGALMVLGAESEWRSLDGQREAQKQIDDDYLERFDLDLGDLLQLHIEAIPQTIRDRIRHAVDEVAQQPFWRAIQDTTQADLAKIIQAGLDEGIAGSTMAKRIAEGLQESGRRRSKLIARTETTGALNAGHDAAITEIAQSGEAIKKMWLSIVDDRCRQSHVDASGQVVAPGANFVIGGYEAPYPGYHGLPAQERLNCRCTTIGSFD